MKIKTKIQLVLVGILLLSGALITALWYSAARSMADTYLNDLSEQTMTDAYHSFEYILADTAYMATRIATNEKNIIEPASNFHQNDYLVDGQWVQGYLDNKRMIIDYVQGGTGYQYYLSGLAVVIDERCIFSTDMSASAREILYDALLQLDQDELKRSVVMLDPMYLEGLSSTASNNYVIPAVRGIVDEHYQVIGYVVIYFDYGVIEQIFSTSMPEGSYFKVMNQQGTEIYSNAAQTWDADYIENSCVTSTFEAEEIQWSFSMSIPTEYYTTRILYTALLTGFIIVAVLLLASITTAVVISKMTGEITVLKNQLDKVAAGDLNTSYTVKRTDEIGQMGKAFNHMVVRTKELMEAVKEEERQKRINEMAFLQAQINPHFISNVLNNVAWMAKLQHADNVVPLVQSLNVLLHDVMHQEKNIIFLSKELEYVTNYLTIMEYSGSYDFQVELDIHPDTEHLCIPSFILQPIIENAIYYGQPEDLSKQGKIKIASNVTDSTLQIIIEDNGPGLTSAKLYSLLHTERKKSSFNGIGVANVSDRIKLFFGEDYGLSYESTTGEFTRCIYTLPIVTEEA